MNLENLISVSGLPGIYRMAANRSNGLIIEDVKTGKRRFASSRKHQFTPLESIAIYTDDGESIELKIVFRNMLQQIADHPPASINAKPEELHEYFADILPNYDRDRVFTGDIKKVIKWFSYLNESGALSEEEEEKTNEEEEE
ncbi:MAG: DUF5606 domain-containing protein [Phaeodactylibacter sp.]|nr:DUF5606 domain-containing protein [Phaeodactylibacter sp.]MCB9051096.1 DUF5606 domain-containing protein [Lewinellaceae bacterium]